MKYVLLAFSILVICNISLSAQTELESKNGIEDRLKVPSSPPSAKPKPEMEEMFNRVLQIPRFPGCESIIGTEAEKKQCADKKMLEFIYGNIVYPEAAKQTGVEGTCVVQFLVQKDGRLTNIKLVRDIGSDCGEEALRVVYLMRDKIKWTPGKARNPLESMQFNLPIKFKLDEVIKE